MKRNKCIIWIIYFMVILIVPAFTYLFLGQYVNSDNHENRILKSKPTLTIDNYVTFPEDYEAYFNDNLPFRDQLIRFNNSIDYFVFNRSSNESVCIGKDGWLFYCYYTDNPIAQSLGYWSFSDDELEAIADNLMSIQCDLEGRGIEFVLFIAPNKELIYIDELPDYYQIENQYTSTDCLVDYLRENTDIRVVYPKDELLKCKEENPDIILYHKLDTHWNGAGAYIGAQCLAEELGIDMPDLGEVSMEQSLSSEGDLADMLNITILNGDIDYEISEINGLITEIEKWDLSTELICHTPGADPRKLFVRRDSFSTALAPIMATQFEDSIWVLEQVFDQQQVFEYDADIFVLEVVERHERDLLDL